MSHPPTSQESLRRLPAVEKLMQAVRSDCALPRVVLTCMVRAEVNVMREEAQAGKEPPEFPVALARLQKKVDAFCLSRIQPVINATGVLLHTNLGRAPLSAAAAEAVRQVASQYNNLEFDLETGDRGKRGRFLEGCLAVATGAKAATVTNNCAAALVLILRALTTPERKEVIISRGQLVEIGGGFRVPEIMETSGATLREVGATNKVSVSDYRKAIGPQTAMLLRVHRSNFYMEGFIGEPGPAELAELGRLHGLPVVEDLGSGALMQTDRVAALEHEMTPQEIIAAGVDLVCFSGDKLFGGPQAGIIVGRPDLIAAIKKDPLFRALRCDKMVIAALQETVLAYLHAMQGEGQSLEAAPLPLLRMLAAPLESLTTRAERIVHSLEGLPAAVSIGRGTSCTGGGTMPRSSIPSVTVDVRPTHLTVAALGARLRLGSPPITAYVAEDALRFDLRTVFAEQDTSLTAALRSALSLS